jgi:hypothetical protein
MNSNEIDEPLFGTGSVPFSAKSSSIEAGIERIVCQPLRSTFPGWIPLTTVTRKSSTYGHHRVLSERCRNTDQVIMAEGEAKACRFYNEYKAQPRKRS